MWFWFGFWGEKLWFLQDILKLVREDEVIYIGEDEIVIKNKNGEIVKKFKKYNPYGKSDCYSYKEETD